MKPPIETITDKIEYLTVFNKCIDSCAYFAEQILGYDVYDYNKVYLDCMDRFIVYRTGRQVGKTRNTAIKAIHFGYFAPLLGNIIDDECTILLISKSEDQAKEMFKRMKAAIDKSDILSKARVSETKTELTLRFFDGSGTTHFIVRPVGETGDATRGYSPNLIIIDEAAYIPQRVFDSILPAGSAVRGKVILTSTPITKAGAFFLACDKSHTLYEKGIPKKLQTKDDAYIWSQFHVTSYDNPTTADDTVFMNMLKTMSQSKVKAEIYGEFLESGNSMFSTDILSDAFNDVPIPEFEYYDLGVDTSGKGLDETVLMDVGVTKEGKCVVVDIYTEETTDQTLLARVIEKKHKVRHYRSINVDSTGMGDGLVDACKHTDTFLPVRTVQFKTEKIEMYNGLVVLFENRGINLSHVSDETQRQV